MSKIRAMKGGGSYRGRNRYRRSRVPASTDTSSGGSLPQVINNKDILANMMDTKDVPPGVYPVAIGGILEKKTRLAGKLTLQAIGVHKGKQFAFNFANIDLVFEDTGIILPEDRPGIVR